MREVASMLLGREVQGKMERETYGIFVGHGGLRICGWCLLFALGVDGCEIEDS